ncbi:hypothetical protein [Mycobacterium sp. HNNTM2301]|uniref:hypothetical protein n=1 Tax=Mycobacterium hainanense TaxID=3289775 RepID=UPI0035A6299F
MNIVGVEAIFTRPCPCVATNSFSVENFLSCRDEFVARHKARIRGIAVATQLDGLYLHDLLGQWLF